MPGVTREIGRTHKSAEPLLSALEYLQAQGSLLSLVPDRAQRLGLMRAMSRNGLVHWDRALSKYALTPLGKQCLSEYQAAANAPVLEGGQSRAVGLFSRLNAAAIYENERTG
jgi:hypothetical protein